MAKHKQQTRSGGKLIALTVRLPEDVYSAARLRGFNEGKSMQEIGLAAFRRFALPAAKREGKVL